jgi:HSP20 family molecular chaperone IbpA
MSKNDTGPTGFSKIARGLSDLFNFLAELDDSEAPRRVIEYSFAKRTLAEDAHDRGEESQPQANEPGPRRAAKPSPLEMLEPVTDIFDEPDEVLLLFELPGVNRKDVRCLLDGDILLLDAKIGDRLYRKETLIEPKLAEGAPHLRLRNGILEVRLAKQQ